MSDADGADLPRTGIEVGAVGVSGEEGLRQCLDALEGRLGLPPRSLEIDRACPTCGSREHGAPELRWADGAAAPAASGQAAHGARVDPLHRRGDLLPAVSVSRTSGSRRVTVLAWCDPVWRVGADVEDLTDPATRRAFAPDGDGIAEIDAVAFSAAERAVLRGLTGEEAVRARAERWCVKEALVKARGTGFTGDPAHASPGAGESTAALGSGLPRWPGPDLGAREALPDGVVLALAWTPADAGSALHHRVRQGGAGGRIRHSSASPP